MVVPNGIQLRPINNMFHVLDSVLLTSATTQTLNLTPYNNAKIGIIVVQCDRNYAILMCVCPVAADVSLLVLTLV